VHQTPQLARSEQKDEPSGAGAVVRRRRLAAAPSRRHAPGGRWGQTLGFVIGILVLSGLTVFIFSTGPNGPTGGVAHQPKAAGSSTAAPTNSAAGMNRAATHDYSLSQPNPGAMQPAVDQQGNIWFGEMFANALARLDPLTGAVSTWTPPGGKNNIMATAIDRQGNVWFTEQAANYIGRFHASSQQFTIYPLSQVQGHSSAPQDLTFDASGNLWFTEVNAARIGRLDPVSGAISTWPVPAPAKGVPSLPFCLAVTPSGQVWFGDLSGGTVGSLDPSTGTVHLHHLASSQTEVYAMSADASGAVWFSELQGGNLGRVNPSTGSVTEIPLPVTTPGSSSGMYDLKVAPNGGIWIASAGANALVRYEPATSRFTFYRLSISGSIPFGLAFDRAGRLWFTASTIPNYIGVMSVN
jgi:virginiamycin B lyase